ncbi:protein of unknown function [Candidatus Nitrosocosmicus franklandus]|uniref:Uncharacterized protein n=1 Tax=Candidatus Nitrosocosmicus franklandianus TaxID=1798806 RepID=A0A484IC78_9ARCH|nr:protein of unknown function [Candidatus Nitrosocosmicus franklandus]
MNIFQHIISTENKKIARRSFHRVSQLSRIIIRGLSCSYDILENKFLIVSKDIHKTVRGNLHNRGLYVFNLGSSSIT